MPERDILSLCAMGWRLEKFGTSSAAAVAPAGGYPGRRDFSVKKIIPGVDPKHLDLGPLVPFEPIWSHLAPFGPFGPI